MATQNIQFNSINASSLFHFTKIKKSFKSILRNGLRYSYSFELIPAKITANINYPTNPNIVETIYEKEKIGVAIPMISFCDIPITRASIHMKRYGKYMIGLDKKHLTEWYKSTINPVLYVHSDNLNDAFIDLSKVFADTYSYEIEQIISLSKKGKNLDSPELKDIVTTSSLRKFFILFFYGLIKPIYNQQTGQCYYDEREWRAFLPDNTYDNKWKWEITKEDYNVNHNDWNKMLEKKPDNYITFEDNLLKDVITHIVVSKESEVHDLTKFIMESNKIFGYTDVSKETRLYLISKITSFERIALDY